MILIHQKLVIMVIINMVVIITNIKAIVSLYNSYIKLNIVIQNAD